MHEYTLDGETYYVAGSRLYTARDETHTVEQVDDHNVHLYESEDYRKYLVRISWGGKHHSSVKVTSIDADGPPERYIRLEDFEGATPVTAKIPDDINECPDCGSWAGKANEDPTCLTCGYGIGTDETTNTESTTIE